MMLLLLMMMVMVMVMLMMMMMMSLKDLVKGQKDFFYMMLSILFSFDIYLVPRSKFLMTKEAKPLRNLLHKQLSDSKSLVSVTINNRFRREFCNRGQDKYQMK